MFIFEGGLGGDGWGYYAIIESLLIDRDFDMENNIYGVENGLNIDHTTGRKMNQYPPGLALMDAPFFLVADRLYTVFNSKLPSKIPVQNENGAQINNRILFRIMGIILAHNFYALLALILLYATLRIHGYTPVLSALMILMCYFASPLHFYAQTGMSHANSFFCIAAILYLFSRYLETQKRQLLFAIGFFCGLAVAVRYVNGLITVLICIFLFSLSKRDKLATLLRFVCGFLIIFWIVPVFWWFHLHQLKPAYTATFLLNKLPCISILFSLKRGFMVFHPLFILFIPGSFLYFSSRAGKKKNSRIVALLSLCAIIALSTSYGYYKEWWGRGTYSQRYIICCIPFFIFCMAPMYTVLSPWRWAVIVFSCTATVFSYALYLISVSRIITFPNGEIWAFSITDFQYLFSEGITLHRFWEGLSSHVYGIKAISYLISALL